MEGNVLEEGKLSHLLEEDEELMIGQVRIDELLSEIRF